MLTWPPSSAASWRPSRGMLLRALKLASGASALHVSMPCVAAVCRGRVPPSVFGTRELYRGRGASGGAGGGGGNGGERLRAQLERVVAPVVILGRGRHLRAHGHPQRRAARV